VKPPTELLSRVQAFLPQMEASNAILAQRAREDPNSVDIEHIPDRMDQYIEMIALKGTTIPTQTWILMHHPRS